MITKTEANERIQKCLTIQDDDGAFACVRETIKELSSQKDVCSPQVVMLTRDDCPYCDEEKETRGDDLRAGIIQEVSVNSERGQKFLEKYAVELVPTILVVDCDDNVIE